MSNLEYQNQLKKMEKQMLTQDMFREFYQDCLEKEHELNVFKQKLVKRFLEQCPFRKRDKVKVTSVTRTRDGALKETVEELYISDIQPNYYSESEIHPNDEYFYGFVRPRKDGSMSQLSEFTRVKITKMELIHREEKANASLS